MNPSSDTPADNPLPFEPGRDERPEQRAHGEHLVERMDELLADRAAQGLSAAEEAELEAHYAQLGVSGDESLDRAAAVGALVFARGEQRALPAGLRGLIQERAARFGRAMRGETLGTLDGGGVVGAASARPPRAFRGASVWTGWLAAAACLGVAVWMSRVVPVQLKAFDVPVVVAEAEANNAKYGNSPVGIYDRLMGSGRDDVVAINARNTIDDDREVQGQLVVDPVTNETLIRLTGLPATGDSDMRYQVWVQDAGREGSQPISAGLVELPYAGASYVIKVAPTVPVIRATGFSITREGRSGAVVPNSDRVIIRGRIHDAGEFGPFGPGGEPTSEGTSDESRSATAE